MHPNSLGNTTRNIPCDAVYNVVLSNGHTLNVNGYWAITLGHEYKLGILAHNYFGSKKIGPSLLSKLNYFDNDFNFNY